MGVKKSIDTIIARMSEFVSTFWSPPGNRHHHVPEVLGLNPSEALIHFSHRARETMREHWSVALRSPAANAVNNLLACKYKSAKRGLFLK